MGGVRAILSPKGLRNPYGKMDHPLVCLTGLIQPFVHTWYNRYWVSRLFRFFFLHKMSQNMGEKLVYRPGSVSHRLGIIDIKANSVQPPKIYCLSLFNNGFETIQIFFFFFLHKMTQNVSKHGKKLVYRPGIELILSAKRSRPPK